MKKAGEKKGVLIKELGNEMLVEHYVAMKGFAHLGAQIRDPKLGYYLKQMDICIAVARQRGVKLPV